MTEAELLLTSLLKCDKAALYLNRGAVLDEGIARRLAQALLRRAEGEPLQYIIGETEFMGLAFKVSPACLIPRPETELLVERGIALVNAVRPADGTDTVRVLDAGTGSGCIAVTLAKICPRCRVTAVDVSPEALCVARANAAFHGVEDRVAFIAADVFGSSLRIPGIGTFDAIISNPPYIPSAQIQRLQPEVRREPRIALDGGSDGCDAYRALASAAADLLRPGGAVIVEIGAGAAGSVRNIFYKSGKFEIIEVVHDYNGVERIMVMRGSAPAHP